MEDLKARGVAGVTASAHRPTLLRDAKASALPLGALAIGVLVASAAVAVDIGIWRLEQGRFQRTLDAASLGAAHALADKPYTDAELLALATYEAQGNGLDPSRATFQVERIDEYTVRITGSLETRNFFSRALKDEKGGAIKPKLGGAAVAGGSIHGTPLCVMSWDPAAEEGFGVRVEDEAEIRANGCRVHSNYAENRSIAIDDSRVGATAICAVGTNEIVSGGQANPVPKEHCEPSHDPFGHIPEPVWPVGDCLPSPHAEANNNTKKNIEPGHYCNGLKLEGQRRREFQPGTYFIDGDFIISGKNARASGMEGVTFIVKNGEVKIDPKHSFDMSAPRTGPYGGVLIWRVEDDAGGCADPLLFAEAPSEGSGDVEWGGAIYAPSCPIEVKGEIEISTPANSFTLIVGRSDLVSDEAVLDINASEPFGEPICSPVGQGGIGLRSSKTVAATDEGAPVAGAESQLP